ncbi:PREDICTED: putative defensin-like protein 221 isoform X2 [Camelina sativa]|uniref:Defensin-like protein 221 isoform X2 n=1 Tax=Camelina sativa TaxID=90675 RepID=A0ABM1R962_CAMSA|nr:PREDICTED: putative defensin-like protein 221 isoform X2 [Camelina sativa]
MKTTFFFLTLAVLCVSNIMAKSILEEKTPSSIPPLSSDIDPIDEHVGHCPDDLKILFCQKCAYHCIEKMKKLFSCDNSICRCAFEDLL